MKRSIVFREFDFPGPPRRMDGRSDDRTVASRRARARTTSRRKNEENKKKDKHQNNNSYIDHQRPLF